jgi:hypothetical protein
MSVLIKSHREESLGFGEGFTGKGRGAGGTNYKICWLNITYNRFVAQLRSRHNQIIDESKYNMKISISPKGGK